jgi:hypothetical protein
MKHNLSIQFKYVNTVILSCETIDQKSNAHKWAWEWSKRAKSNFPNIIHSHIDLFLDVIRKDILFNK